MTCFSTIPISALAAPRLALFRAQRRKRKENNLLLAIIPLPTLPSFHYQHHHHYLIAVDAVLWITSEIHQISLVWWKWVKRKPGNRYLLLVALVTSFFIFIAALAHLHLLVALQVLPCLLYHRQSQLHLLLPLQRLPLRLPHALLQSHPTGPSQFLPFLLYLEPTRLHLALLHRQLDTPQQQSVSHLPHPLCLL